MRIRKKTLLFGSYIVIFIVLAIAFSAAVAFVNNAWNDPTTWTSQGRLILPQTNPQLRIATTGDVQNGDFTVNVDYCALYKNIVNTDSVTLYCSLLPWYYFERQTEVPKDWQEKGDITLTISKTDPEATALLGRSDTSFLSLAALDNAVKPVSIQVSGTALKPAATLQNKVNHAIAVINKKQDRISMRISSYAVNDLQKPTTNQLDLYTKNWLTQVDTQLNSLINPTQLKSETARELLDTLRDTLGYHRQKCTNMTSCENAYQGNAAVPVMYYVYDKNLTDTSVADKVRQALDTTMWPFTGSSRVAVTPEPGTSTSDWTDFAPYEFPICPLPEVMANKRTANTNLFAAYMKSEVPLSENTITTVLTSYSGAGYVQNQQWESDLVRAVNAGCLEILNGNKDTLLRQNVTRVYLDMLSTMLGQKVTLDNKGSFLKGLYLSSDLTPYNSVLLTDMNVSRYLEAGGNDPSSKTAQSSTEWKSYFLTLITKYVYEAQYK